MRYHRIPAPGGFYECREWRRIGIEGESEEGKMRGGARWRWRSGEVEKRRGFHDPENPADFIDVYLSELEKGNDLSVLDLVACIQDFFMAGTETSSTTLKWILLYLTLHQDVQER